jgi:hypothetical protein
MIRAESEARYRDPLLTIETTVSVAPYGDVPPGLMYAEADGRDVLIVSFAFERVTACADVAENILSTGKHKTARTILDPIFRIIV